MCGVILPTSTTTKEWYSYCTCMKRAKEQFSIFLAAWIYFTRVPLPRGLTKYADGSQQSLEQAVRLLPIFGILVGGVASAIFVGADFLFDSKALAVLLSMVATILITGALHEDGLGDFFDGFGGGWWSKERVLEIMKDSRLGTFGAIALIIALLAKYQALVAIPSALIPASLVAGHAFSRFAAASFFFTNHYARTNDQGHTKPMPKAQMKFWDFCILAAFGIIPLLLFGNLLYLLLVPILWLVRHLFGRWFVRKLGGYTGDCLGATQQTIEICFYLGVLMIARFAA